jgi:hypothetical protein
MPRECFVGLSAKHGADRCGVHRVVDRSWPSADRLAQQAVRMLERIDARDEPEC